MHHFREYKMNFQFLAQNKNKLRIIRKNIIFYCKKYESVLK